MATTALGGQLTEAHRLAQGKISLQVAADITAIFPLWDPKKPSSFDVYTRLALAAISTRKEQSASLALRYLRLFREAEGVPGTFPTGVLSPQVNTDAVTTSLRVTGPVTAYQALGAGQPIEQAVQRALASSVASSIRHARSGGRETTYNLMQADDHAVGWARVTDGNPCYFCALLASRGPVYKSEATAGFKVHDGACGCEPEPVYESGDAYKWPNPEAKDWHQLYLDESTGTGKEALRSFRRAYESRHKA